MRVLCLLIEHFPTAAELREHPELEGRVIVIGGLAHERKTVFDCSHEASHLGIRPGVSLREAQHLCPDAVFLPPDHTRYASTFDEVLDILEVFSPLRQAIELAKSTECRLARHLCRSCCEKELSFRDPL